MHVPDGWEVIEVGKLIKVTTGNKDTVNADSDGIYPFVIRSQDLLKINTYSFDGEAVLIAGDGDIRNIFHYFNGKFDFHQRVYCLHSFKKNLNGKYFYYFFRHNFVNQVNKYSAKGTVDSVRLEMITKMPMNVPPVKEQEKIAKILSTLDKSIEATNRLIEKEKNIKKALIQELLTNGIDKDGHIRTRATHTYKESELGLIPDEWEVVDFKKAINLIDGDRGTNYPKDEDFSEHGYCVFLSAKNVTKDGFRFNEIQFITKDKDEQLRKGKLAKNDIVLTTRGTVGNIAYFDESIIFQNMRINSGMIILRNQNHILSNDYLYIFLKSGLFEQQIANTVFGSAQPQLTVKEIEKFSICFPNKTEQKQIAKILTAQDKKIETEETNLAKLKELKKGLMNDLLSGKVRMKI